ncbi:MAG: hypothetical protein ROR55_02905 [Devosia sp.]
MNYVYDPKEMDRIAEARESYSGRLLTDKQFDEAIGITHILEREIKASGKFKDKLGDYAYAVARTDRMDVTKAETMLRDLFRARVGMSMNQMREDIMKREDALTPEQKRRAESSPPEIEAIMRNGRLMTFNRAFSHAASELSKELQITEHGARSLIRDSFKERNGERDIYDWGKELDEAFYRPQVEADRQARAARRTEPSSDERGPSERTPAQSYAPRPRYR